MANGSLRDAAWWLLRLARPMLVVALLFVGWLALLAFPWHWAVPVELLAILPGLMLEYSGRNVGSAAGWMTFAYLAGHVCLSGAVLLLRLALWPWHKVVMQQLAGNPTAGHGAWRKGEGVARYIARAAAGLIGGGGYVAGVLYRAPIQGLARPGAGAPLHACRAAYAVRPGPVGQALERTASAALIRTPS